MLPPSPGHPALALREETDKTPAVKGSAGQRHVPSTVMVGPQQSYSLRDTSRRWAAGRGPQDKGGVWALTAGSWQQADSRAQLRGQDSEAWMQAA